MKAAAQADGVTPPAAMAEKEQALLDKLQSAEGEAFDQAYLTAQVASHDEAVAVNGLTSLGLKLKNDTWFLVGRAESAPLVNATRESHLTWALRFAEDVCVPVGRLADYVRGAAEVSARWDVAIPVSGHAGDGNLHPSIVYPHGDDDARQRAWGAFDELMRLGLSLGGTVAGEHGIGSVKRRWLVEEVGRAEVERQRAIKAVFDPSGIMNPEAVFDTPGRLARAD